MLHSALAIIKSDMHVHNVYIEDILIAVIKACVTSLDEIFLVFY